MRKRVERRSVRTAASCVAEGLEGRVFLSSAPTFQAQMTSGPIVAPFAVAVGDINGDGKPDLLVGAKAYFCLNAMLGNGDGTFQPQSRLTGGFTVYDVALSDVNRDGKLDAVYVGSVSGGSAGVMLGNSNGTFKAARTVLTSSRPNSVALADMNGDGKLDLVTANYGGGGVSVLLGNGDGSFKPQNVYTAVDRPYSLAVADINGDGRQDVVVTNDEQAGSFGVLLGNGVTQFNNPISMAVGRYPGSVAVADFNSDGKPDVALVNTYMLGGGTANAQVFLGNGDGKFTPSATLSTGTITESLTAADLNGDGKPDLVVSNYNTLQVFTGNGDGTFQSPRSFSAGNSAVRVRVTVADVNVDGRPDILNPNSTDGTLSVFLGDPPPVARIGLASPGGMVSGTSVAFTVTFSEPVTGVDPSDFTLSLNNVTTTPPLVVSGSGASYTVTANGVSGTGNIGLNLVDDGTIHDSGGNTLQGWYAITSQQTLGVGQSPRTIAAADLNRDGKADLVIPGNAPNYQVGVLLGNGNGTFQTRQTYSTGSGSYPSAVSLGDVNGDGKPDIALANFSGQSVGLLLGNGDGTFSQQATFSAPGSPHAIVEGDVNGDGKTDLAVALWQGSAVGILLGNGNGTFQAVQTFTTGSGSLPADIALVDLNSDGILDVVTANQGSGNVSGSIGVLLGNGNGTFAPQVTYNGGSTAHELAVADFNRDGKPDLAVGDSGQFGGLTVLLGNGNGTLAGVAAFSLSANPYSISTADLNGDGIPDLEVADEQGVNPSNVAVLLGNGNGTFARQTTFQTGLDSKGLAAADVNGDGVPDLLVTNSASASASISPVSRTGSLAGPSYFHVPYLDTINGSSGVDQIGLQRDSDQVHIDWTLGTTIAQMSINDPAGLTINGKGSNDVITLDATFGAPLPNTLHLNGTFTISGYQAGQLAGNTVDIGQSTVYFAYNAGNNPFSDLLAALKAGYNAGAWNGPGAGGSGAINSSAVSGPSLGIGYADSADNAVTGQPANTIELRFTAVGDANLDRTVNSADSIILARNYLRPFKSRWDLGNFNYDSTIDYADALLLQKNFNVTVTGAAAAGDPSTPVAADPIVTPVSPQPPDNTAGGTGSTDTETSSDRPDDTRDHHKKGASHRRRGLANRTT